MLIGYIPLQAAFGASTWLMHGLEYVVGEGRGEIIGPGRVRLVGPIVTLGALRPAQAPPQGGVRGETSVGPRVLASRHSKTVAANASTKAMWNRRCCHAASPGAEP